MKASSLWLRNLGYLFLSILLAILLFRLGRDYLFDWDEAIYAELGREMVASRDWLTPTWNGAMWLEKPPAIAWLTSLSFWVVGTNELGARFFMPFLAVATLYAVFRIGNRLGGSASGLISAAMLAYFNLFLSRARTLNTDILLLAALTWTVWLLLAGSSPWLIGFVMGLAVLAKGPAGLLALVIALPLLRTVSRKSLGVMLLAFLITVLPWHLYAYLRYESEFITPYLLEQVIRRATVPIEFHLESRYYYLNFLKLDLGLGVLFVAALGLVKSFRKYRVLTWWALIPLVLFTVAKTRLSWYILPIYPAIALAIGYLFSETFSRLAGIHSRTYVKIVNLIAVGVMLQSVLHAWRYIEPSRVVSKLPEKLTLAQSLASHPATHIYLLVGTHERTAAAILPKDQSISSSFRYGGAPSLVWYSRKPIRYYYNYDNFRQDLASVSEPIVAVVERPDRLHVPPDFVPILETENLIALEKGTLHADR